MSEKGLRQGWLLIKHSKDSTDQFYPIIYCKYPDAKKFRDIEKKKLSNEDGWIDIIDVGIYE